MRTGFATLMTGEWDTTEPRFTGYKRKTPDITAGFTCRSEPIQVAVEHRRPVDGAVRSCVPEELADEGCVVLGVKTRSEYLVVLIEGVESQTRYGRIRDPFGAALDHQWGF
jgi:hypothetical protein